MFNALWDWTSPWGSKDSTYWPHHPYTRNSQTYAGMDAINAVIRKGRAGYRSGRLSVGTWEAFVNTALDGSLGRFSIAEAQLGAFDAAYRINGVRTTAAVTVTNPISLNSALFHVSSGTAWLSKKVGTPSGFGRAVEGLGTVQGNHLFGVTNQTFKIAEPNPCF